MPAPAAHLAPAPISLHVEARGPWAHRIALLHRRLDTGAQPAFDHGFVLADVRYDGGAHARRFDEFSGDLSGRWLGALALLPSPESPWRLAGLARSLCAEQRADGRFGDTHLDFTGAIGSQHMALLWGNGRLLVGLCELYSRDPQPLYRDTARRLGDFCAGVARHCLRPEVQAAVAGLGAFGFICLTQLNEGLVLLDRCTGEARFHALGVELLRWLQARPGQHSHGWLSTLRGAMLVYEDHRDPALLADIRQRFDDLLASGDRLATGGVPEYFLSVGAVDGTLAQHSGHELRDEGCSHADFIRLALQLWRATGATRYLAEAEHCLFNQFAYNQFETGDFGHHVLTRQGFKANDNLARAWWCCTLHGLRAFRDVLDHAVVRTDAGWRLDLPLDCAWEDRGLAFASALGADGLSVEATAGDGVEGELAVRIPAWAEAVSARLAGSEIAIADGMVRVRRAWRAGDRLEVRFRLRSVLRRRDGSEVDPAAIGAEPVEAMLQHGPWVLGVDEARSPLFFGEPWPANRIELPLAAATGAEAAIPLQVAGTGLQATCHHDGFDQPAPVRLHPIGEQTCCRPGAVAYWLNWTAPTRNPSMKLLAGVLPLLATVGLAQAASAPAFPTPAAAVETAHAEIWRRFMAKDGTIYDYTDMDGKVILPTAEDCANNRPNGLGWWTPTESGGMYGGIYMDGLVSRWERTRAPADAERARTLAKGLIHLASVGSTPGFIARGTASDGKGHYPASSDDQSYPWFYGMWRYLSSGIPAADERARMLAKVEEVADAFAAARWHIPSDRPGFGAFGVWEGPHFDANVRLLFIHRALIDLTGKQAWKDAYQARIGENAGRTPTKRVDLAAAGSLYVVPGATPKYPLNPPIWTSASSQAGLRALADLETDPVLKAKYRAGLVANAQRAVEHLARWRQFDAAAAAKLRFSVDWRVLNEAKAGWVEQTTIKEAVALGIHQYGPWKEASPRRIYENDFMRDPLFAAWVIALSADAATIASQRGEIDAMLTHYDWRTMYTATFLMAENVYWRTAGTPR